MVKLIGVQLNYENESGQGLTLANPSPQFLEELTKMEPSKIGLCYFPPDKLPAIERDIKVKFAEAMITRSAKLGEDHHYWEKLSNIAKHLGHRVEFIDTYESAIEAHSLIRDCAVAEEKKFPGFSYAEGARQMQEIFVHRTRYSYFANIIQPERYLNLALEKGLDILVATLDNAMWLAYKNPTMFSSYHVEHAEEGTMHFIKAGVPSIADVQKQERAIRRKNIISGGGLFETPTYCGIFDLVTPGEGYFEMMIDIESDEQIRGRIRDAFGDAVFRGKRNAKFLDFVKEYTLPMDQSIAGAPIVYRGTIAQDEISGSFIAQDEIFGAFATVNGVKPFYMCKPLKTHIEMALRLDELRREKGR